VPDARAPSMPELLAALPESQREVLLLLKGCGMTLEEVARTTSSTVGAVKQKAHRAYQCLRAALASIQQGQVQ
jgi:RNA polymerase sigma-70 factor, ECF subfamily